MTRLDPDLLHTCSSSALGFFNGASIVVLTVYVLRQFCASPIIAHIRHRYWACTPGSFESFSCYYPSRVSKFHFTSPYLLFIDYFVVSYSDWTFLQLARHSSHYKPSR